MSRRSRREIDAALSSACGDDMSRQREIDAALDSICGEGTAAKITAISAATPTDIVPLPPGNKPTIAHLTRMINDACERLAKSETVVFDARLEIGQHLPQSVTQ